MIFRGDSCRSIVFFISVIVFLVSTNGTRASELLYPLDVTVSNKDLYIVDRNVPAIWKVTDGKLSYFFKGSKEFRTPMNAVRCITTDTKGRLIAGDSSTREIYRFNQNGQPKPLTNGNILIPLGIVDDGKGNLFVTDLQLGRIWKVPADGGNPTEFAVVNAPRGITIDVDGNLLVVSSGTKSQLVRISPSGQIDVVIQGRPFQFPHDIVIDKKNIAYISDGYGKAIWKVDSSGKIEKWLSGKPFVNPVGLAWQGDNLLIADPRAKMVFQANPKGELQPLNFQASEK